jgi:hypothetical protein
MATTFKTFLNNDVISSRTLLHEAIPLTGSILSGTYADSNIKNFSHGMFQSSYDYPYLSSSANHILDITAGYHSDCPLSASTGATQRSKKINIYNQMAQVLMGHDASGDIQKFDEDGDLTGGTKMESCVFINFSRLLTKDEIKKGSFKVEFGMEPLYDHATTNNKARVKLTDVDAQNEYRINSPAGEYGVLIADTTIGDPGNSDSVVLNNDGGTLASGQKAGLIFYQAGIAVVTSSLFKDDTDFSGKRGGLGIINWQNTHMSSSIMSPTGSTGDHGLLLDQMMVSSSISAVADAIRHRIYNIQFNNTTELNSTIYFCRVNNNDYNYSSNPTYLSGSKIRVKDTTSDEPTSYITTVGLYSSDNELLAVAKLSEPLKKTPSNEMTLRVRLDY